MINIEIIFLKAKENKSANKTYNNEITQMNKITVTNRRQISQILKQTMKINETIY